MEVIARLRQALAICAVLLVPATANAFTLHNLPDGSPLVRTYDPCTGVTTGGTTLPDGGQVLHWEDPGDVGGVIDALKWQFGTDVIHGYKDGASTTTPRDPSKIWSFGLGSAVAGDLYIDQYLAIDSDGVQPGTGKAYPGYCFHGATLKAHFDKNADSPAHLGWVQLIMTDHPQPGIPSGAAMYVDPFPNDGTDDGPFYWNGTDHPIDISTYNLFSDTSSRSHWEEWNWSGHWRANLFLVSWDEATPRKLTIRDGIQWAWDGECVPEPSAVAVLIVGGACLVLLAARSRGRQVRARVRCRRER